MKKKLTSYQKLKLENEKLKKDIYNIIEMPNTLVGETTIKRYKFKFDTAKAFWFGSRTIQHYVV